MNKPPKALELFGIRMLHYSAPRSRKLCDTCDKRLAVDRFFTKTTCRACYTGARR